MPENSIIKKFNEIANLLKKRYNIDISLVEISGKRWSYITGIKDESLLPKERIKLTDKFGIVAVNWDKIPEKEKKAIIENITSILSI